LSRRRVKRVVSALARWEGVQRPSRSKQERGIKVKMGYRTEKETCVSPGQEINGCIVEHGENYTSVFRARGA
jgi:hypothetical protein